MVSRRIHSRAACLIQEPADKTMGRSSLLSYLENFEKHGSATAYAFRRGYRTERWSYGRVARSACQFARLLETRGLRKGQRLLLWGNNSAEWVVAFLGSLLRG